MLEEDFPCPSNSICLIVFEWKLNRNTDVEKESLLTRMFSFCARVQCLVPSIKSHSPLQNPPKCGILCTRAEQKKVFHSCQHVFLFSPHTGYCGINFPYFSRHSRPVQEPPRLIKGFPLSHWSSLTDKLVWAGCAPSVWTQYGGGRGRNLRHIAHIWYSISLWGEQLGFLWHDACERNMLFQYLPRGFKSTTVCFF